MVLTWILHVLNAFKGTTQIPSQRIGGSRVQARILLNIVGLSCLPLWSTHLHTRTRALSPQTPENKAETQQQLQVKDHKETLNPITPISLELACEQSWVMRDVSSPVCVVSKKPISSK